LAGLFGLIIGFPALRLKGFYLAIATMALGTAVTDVIKRMEILGADRGLTNVPPVTIFGYQFSSEFAKYYLYLAILLLTIFLVNNLLKSKTGMAFRAMRDSEVAAKVFGINISYYKVLAFVISSFLAGVAGACMVILFHICTQTCSDLACPLSFLLLPSLEVLVPCGALCSVPPCGSLSPDYLVQNWKPWLESSSVSSSS